jgi:hypothetical protein
LASSQRSASRAAMQPVPAADTAWRYTLSCTSPHANTPGTLVYVDPARTLTYPCDTSPNTPTPRQSDRVRAGTSIVMGTT